MHFSSQVDFSRRFGKTIGSNIGGLGYEFKKHLETLSSIEQRQLYFLFIFLWYFKLYIMCLFRNKYFGINIYVSMYLCINLTI